jgi:hypothetical protein
VIEAGSIREKHWAARVYSWPVRSSYTLPAVLVGLSLLLSLFMSLATSTDVD